jgi:membrane protein DedA with SNARE-associated domain
VVRPADWRAFAYPAGVENPASDQPRTPRRPQPSRRTLWLLLTPIAALSLAGMLGDWFAAALINEHPLLQMFINPRNRYLALASNRVDTVPFYVVGFLRLVLTDPLFFLVGYYYGDAGLRWAERKMGDDAGMIKAVERFFAKASYPIVLLMPNGYVCMMAGAAGMPLGVFILLNVTGTAFRLVLIRELSATFDGPLEAILRFIQRYQWWLVGFSVAVGLYQVISNRRKGKGEIALPSTMSAELEAEAAKSELGPHEQAGEEPAR